MRKLILIIFTLILIGAGCGKAKSSPTPQTQPSESNVGTIEKTPAIRFSFNECVENFRQAGGTVERPEGLDQATAETLYRDACYVEQAKVENNISVCEKISTKFREKYSLNEYAN